MAQAQFSNPVPDKTINVLYRQTYNTYGTITSAGLTQNNITLSTQSKANTQLSASTTPLGILGGSVVSVVGNGLIGPCVGDLTTAQSAWAKGGAQADTTQYDRAVGIAVNNALGNPYESSSALASNCVVYAHGTGTVIQTSLYETYAADGSTAITYTAGDKMYPSQNGLLTNQGGLDGTVALANATLMGILLSTPDTNGFIVVQLRV
jgi:hypothetical protein